MRNFPVLLLFLLPGMITASEPVERKITMVQEATRITERDIRKATKSESEKNTDGGYNANVSVVDCFAAMKYHYTGGRYDNEPLLFRLLSPDQVESGKTYPLIIWFHGKGESGEDNTRQLSHVQSTLPFLAGKEKLEFFMVATQCPKDNPYWETTIEFDDKGDASMTILNEIIEAILEEYPIDRNRIGVFGLCSGGNAAWQYVANHPGRFASLAVCSSTPPAEPTDLFLNTAIWAFNNEDDTVPFQNTERFVEMINEAGGNAYLTLHQTGGHDAWSGALANDKVIGWMLLQSLDKPGPPQGVICYHRSKIEQFFLFGLPVLCLIVLSAVFAMKKKKCPADET